MRATPNALRARSGAPRLGTPSGLELVPRDRLWQARCARSTFGRQLAFAPAQGRHRGLKGRGDEERSRKAHRGPGGPSDLSVLTVSDAQTRTRTEKRHTRAPRAPASDRRALLSSSFSFSGECRPPSRGVPLSPAVPRLPVQAGLLTRPRCAALCPPQPPKEGAPALPGQRVRAQRPAGCLLGASRRSPVLAAPRGPARAGLARCGDAASRTSPAYPRAGPPRCVAPPARLLGGTSSRQFQPPLQSRRARLREQTRSCLRRCGPTHRRRSRPAASASPVQHRHPR